LIVQIAEVQRPIRSDDQAVRLLTCCSEYPAAPVPINVSTEALAAHAGVGLARISNAFSASRRFTSPPFLHLVPALPPDAASAAVAQEMMTGEKCFRTAAVDSVDGSQQ
jgi:hypothetical protein